MIFSTYMQVSACYSVVVAVEQGRLIEQVGSLQRACGWPPCRSRSRGLLVERPSEDWSRGRLPLYCSVTCRMAAQKRRRKLRRALNDIDAAIADVRLARHVRDGPAVLTKRELRQWRARIVWELDGLASGEHVG